MTKIMPCLWFDDRIDEAIVREKALKKWNRVWKLRIISEANPEWADLFETLNA